LQRFAVSGDCDEVVRQLAELRKSVKPPLFVFDAYDYSVDFVHELAALLAEAGVSSGGPT
ncbi:MAG TPA: hypothetical protein VFG86_19000, partial [Chloroflexota bacterium]|nr:hypothetical protein [Chloroflexota bacterium]